MTIMSQTVAMKCHSLRRGFRRLLVKMCIRDSYGAGLSALSLADRATVANMAPEYGATMGFFPVDQETLEYLKFTNRDPDLVALVERCV